MNSVTKQFEAIGIKQAPTRVVLPKARIICDPDTRTDDRRLLSLINQMMSRSTHWLQRKANLTASER